MKIRPIPFSDELFYWLRTGKQPTVLDIRCTLAEKVVPRALKTALGSALRVHTNFRIRPVIVQGAFLMPERFASGRRSIRMLRL